MRFDTNVRGLPWDFTPEQASQTIRIGDTGLAFFKVTNHGLDATGGPGPVQHRPRPGRTLLLQAPSRFCWQNQTIKAEEAKEFPVAYFVDPRFAKGDDAQGLKEITLSYTFFPAADARAQSAQASELKRRQRNRSRRDVTLAGSSQAEELTLPSSRMMIHLKGPINALAGESSRSEPVEDPASAALYDPRNA